MNLRKPDADVILARLTQLKAANWLGSPRRYWPNYVFHFSDIRNIAAILTKGQLVARHFLSEGESLDIASRQVIDHTEVDLTKFVRLYFRPRTPTQYHNEGIRPKSKLTALGAHCPVPVFLVFDSADLLTREKTLFSEGNLAAGSAFGGTANDIERIPFHLVYHDSPLDESQKSKIVFHRNAEVLYPERLDLSTLKAIVLRSEAEMETLRNLLSRDVNQQYASLLKLATTRNLFFRQWTFVESVELEQHRIQIQFSLSSRTPSPFHIFLRISDLETSATLSWSAENADASQKITIDIPQFVGERKSYRAELTLDENLAYCGTFVPAPTLDT